VITVRAWPYAVARGKASGYQAIVVPDFLGEAGLSYLLEYASDGDAGDPGVATVREVAGAPVRPLSLVYRVVRARAGTYGLGGDEPLRDQAGRVIPVFEGLVLQLPADRATAVRLTTSDLDEVTRVTVPAFRRLWTAASGIDAEPSAAVSVGLGQPGTRPLDLRVVKPYVVPGTAPYVIPGTDPPPHRGRGPLVAAGALVCVLIALIVWLLLPSGPSAQAAVTQLCANLQKGRISQAYQQFSAGYQRSTSLAAFGSRLAGLTPSVSCTTAALNQETNTSDQAALSLRLSSGTIRAVDVNVQLISGQWQMTRMRVST
jgi:hypothetical protein